MLRVCYVDESGCTGLLPSRTSPVQPVFVVGGIVFHQNHIAHLTQEYISLKRKFYPGLMPKGVPFLHHVKAEIKGAAVRHAIRTGNRNQRRHAMGFLDGFVTLLEHYGAKVIGRIWIKGIGQPMDGHAIYTFSIQSVCTDLQNLLEFENMDGVIIADSRTHYQNVGVSHSIFTQKFKATGDAYSRILEMPTFGHSENHVGLQLADLLSSGLLFPMAARAYCDGHVDNVHCHPRYQQISDRYGAQIKALQYRYLDGGRNRGGITVSDPVGGRHGGKLFGEIKPEVRTVITRVAASALAKTDTNAPTKIPTR